LSSSLLLIEIVCGFFVFFRRQMNANVDAPASQLLPLARQMQQQQQVSGLKVLIYITCFTCN
jgi:hypothetical protein